MPIAPAPMKYSCPTCGWKKTISPRSDAFVEELPTACPICNEKNINRDKGSHVLSGFEKIIEDIKKILR